MKSLFPKQLLCILVLLRKLEKTFKTLSRKYFKKFCIFKRFWKQTDEKR